MKRVSFVGCDLRELTPAVCEGFGARELREIEFSGCVNCNLDLAFLASCPNLTKLEIKNCRGQVTCSHVLSGVPYLYWVDFSGTAITRDFLDKWVNVPIRSVFLEGCPITDEALRAFVHEHRALRVLDISRTLVDDLTCLSALSRIDVLFVNGLTIDKSDAIAIGALRTLTVLHMAECELAEGWAALTTTQSVQAITVHKCTAKNVDNVGEIVGLRSCDVSHTQFGDRGMALLRLNSSKSIRVLRIGGTQVSERGLQRVVWLESLSRLHIAPSQFSEGAIEQVKRKLPECDIAF